jgi:hypothetical protein
VEKLFPDLVSEDGDGYKMVDYSKLSLYLLQAVKEEHARVEELGAAVKQLRGEIAELRAQRASGGGSSSPAGGTASMGGTSTPFAWLALGLIAILALARLLRRPAPTGSRSSSVHARPSR